MFHEQIIQFIFLWRAYKGKHEFCLCRKVLLPVMLAPGSGLYRGGKIFIAKNEFLLRFFRSASRCNNSGQKILQNKENKTAADLIPLIKLILIN